MTNVFHKHLDVCVQCAEHPWGLCKDGARLLEEAAKKAMDEMAVYGPSEDDADREPWHDYDEREPQ